MFDKLKDAAKDISSAAADKIGKSLAELNDTIARLKPLGLSVQDVKVSMGVMPEISARFVGSIAALEPGALKEAAAKHQDNKLLVALIETLRTAGTFKDDLSALACQGIALDVMLGIPPKFGISLLRSAAADV
jgi:hypothetical protein